MTSVGNEEEDVIVLDDGDDGDVILLNEDGDDDEPPTASSKQPSSNPTLLGMEFIPLDKGAGNGEPKAKKPKKQLVSKREMKKTRSDASLYPWLSSIKSLPKVPIIALHEEILSFNEYMKPTKEERLLRERVVQRITDVIKSKWPLAEVLIFGSYKTNLYLPTSDIDFVVNGQWPHPPLHTLARALEAAGIPDKMEVISKARVPIVKFRDKMSQINIDISFNQPTGPLDADNIITWSKKYDGIVPLVMVIKQFLLQRELNEPFHGGIGSYAVFLLVMSFIQRRPAQASPGNNNLGVMLIEFFELYGRHFNFNRVGIDVTDGGSYFDKYSRRMVSNRDVMCIQNPRDSKHDVTGNAFATPQIRETFAHAYHTLASFMAERWPPKHAQARVSYLGSVVQVDEETQEYRDWVHEIMQKHILDDDD